jgi:serine/threonine protein kinase
MTANRPGDLIAGRFRLADLLSEIERGGHGGRFWRADDTVLGRPVSIDIVDADDERSIRLAAAARASAAVGDPRLLRVLDASHTSDDDGSGDDFVYVVNEWGDGISLDNLLLNQGPLDPRRAAWIVSEVADCLTRAHALGHTHGRLIPENVLLDRLGAVRLIGFAVEAALYGLPELTPQQEMADLAGLLHAGLTATWPGRLASRVPSTPSEHGQRLRPRQIRAGVPGVLDDVCHQLLTPDADHPGSVLGSLDAAGLHAVLADVVGDPADLMVGEDGSAPAITPRRTTGMPPVSQADIPTQFDLPVFEDGDDVVRGPVLAPEPMAQSSRSLSGDMLRLPEDPVPGRRWLRLGAGVAVALVLFVALVLGFHHFRDNGPVASPESSQTPEPTPSAEAVAITGLKPKDYDPQGHPSTENPKSVKLAVDGNPMTGWTTKTYLQNFGPGLYKTGVGLVVDLGADYGLTDVQLTALGGGSIVELYASDTFPLWTEPEGEPAATVTFTGQDASTQQLTLDPEVVTGRYLTLWFTKLTPVEDGFRGEIDEVAVTGRKVG